ncbi:MAG: DUF5522 domain-containing protein [Pyrinomonadaceae bacterium]|nr:DUF5522 domain-containing protein [Pyrinomonadaceae bacterium]
MSKTKHLEGNHEPAADTAAADGPNPVLQEGIDYYFENGLMVFTDAFLGRRGYCCEQGCRHCPYGYSESKKHSSDVR